MLQEANRAALVRQPAQRRAIAESTGDNSLSAIADDEKRGYGELLPYMRT